MVSFQSIQNQTFIRLGDLEVGEASPVSQVELCDHGLHRQARQFRVHLEIDRLVGLNADDELISWNVLEDARGHILELNPNLGLLLVERLSGLQDERNAVPSLVLDKCNHGTEGGASRVFWNCVVLFVRRLGAVKRPSILPDDDVLGLNLGNSSEHSDFLVTNVLAGKGNGSLHRQQGQDLQKMVLHDITDDAELVKVPTSAFGTKRLLEGDLDVVDVIAVPGCSQELVTESQNQQVLDHLLSEIVVDTEDLLFFPVGLEAIEYVRTVA